MIEYTMFYFDCWCELIINIINIYRYIDMHICTYIINNHMIKLK